MRCFWKTVWVFAIACIAVNALAQQGVTEGTYGVTGGSYRIQVKQGPDGLLVVEPNKTSPYTRRAHMASDPGRIDVEPKARYLLLAMVLIP